MEVVEVRCTIVRASDRSLTSGIVFVYVFRLSAGSYFTKDITVHCSIQAGFGEAKRSVMRATALCWAPSHRMTPLLNRRCYTGMGDAYTSMPFFPGQLRFDNSLCHSQTRD